MDRATVLLIAVGFLVVSLGLNVVRWGYGTIQDRTRPAPPQATLQAVSLEATEAATLATQAVADSFVVATTEAIQTQTAALKIHSASPIATPIS